jgi:hypothetical protein
MRVDRLLSEHGIGQDSAAGRQEFERQMERRRLEAIDKEALQTLRRGWHLGSEQFKEQTDGLGVQVHTGEVVLQNSSCSITEFDVRARRHKIAPDES